MASLYLGGNLFSLSRINENSVSNLTATGYLVLAAPRLLSRNRMNGLVLLSLGLVANFLVACSNQIDSSKSAAGASPAPSVSGVPAPIQVRGTVDGGGGKGVLCGNRLVTLDRFEAERDFGSAVHLEGATVDEALLSMMERFGSHTATEPMLPMVQWSASGKIKLLKQWQEMVGDHLKPVLVGTRLAPTQDATLPLLPPTCSFVQIAVYESTGTIQYDTEYWNMLEPIDVAVLYAHEYYYAEFRKFGAKTSDETRQMIARALANKLKPMFEELWFKPHFVSCYGGDKTQSFEFSVSDSGSGLGVDVYFRLLGTKYVYTQTHGSASGFGASQFMSGGFPKNSLEVTEDVFGTKWTVDIEPNTLGRASSQILIRAYRKSDPLPNLAEVRCRVENQKPPAGP